MTLVDNGREQIVTLSPAEVEQALRDYVSERSRIPVMTDEPVKVIAVDGQCQAVVVIQRRTDEAHVARRSAFRVIRAEMR
jgi:hypothetical protein